MLIEGSVLLPIDASSQLSAVKQRSTERSRRSQRKLSLGGVANSQTSWIGQKDSSDTEILGNPKIFDSCSLCN